MGRMSSNSDFPAWPVAALRGAFALAVALLGAALLPSQGTAGESVMQGMEKEVEGIFERTKDAVVKIQTIVPVNDAQSGKKLTDALTWGTGFFVDNKGHVLTAASVVRGSPNAMVYWRGKGYEARTIGSDSRSNLALLKIDAETTSLAVGDPESLKVGSMALAVGYPMDQPLSVEYGNISNLDAGQMPRFFATTHIRSNVRVQPGQSGSPFLNSKGQVVGMVVYAMDDGSSTFALPITAAKKVQKDLMDFHAARYGWTGLTIAVVDKPMAEGQGIAVRDVYQGYPGHQSGIQSGDLILKIGTKEIRSPADVMNATFYLSIGENVDFTIQHEGETKVVPVKVVERPNEKEMLALKTVSTPSPLR